MASSFPHFSQILNVARSRGASSEAPNLWKGAVALWPLQDGGGITARDVSGFGNDGTLTAMDPATDWVTWENGFALDFLNTASQYIAGPTSFSLGTTYSIVVWAKQPSFGVRNVLSVAGSQLTDVNASDFRWQINNNSATEIKTTMTRSANTWYQYAVSSKSIASGDTKLYVNGRDVGVDKDLAVPATGALGIGRRESGADRYWLGQIGSVLIYNRPVTPSEITQHYVDPNAMFRQRRVMVAVPALTGSPGYYNWRRRVA